MGREDEYEERLYMMKLIWFMRCRCSWMITRNRYDLNARLKLPEDFTLSFRAKLKLTAFVLRRPLNQVFVSLDYRRENL